MKVDCFINFTLTEKEAIALKKLLAMRGNITDDDMKLLRVIWEAIPDFEEEINGRIDSIS
jgi:hypothetical protein